MATIKDKTGAFCARHSRRLAALQFALLILVIAGASAASGWAWTRMIYVEQHAGEITRLQDINRERLTEKDEVIAGKDAQIATLTDKFDTLTDRLDALTGKMGTVAGKTERAADTAKAAADKADKAVKQSAPRVLPPQPAPDWLGGP